MILNFLEERHCTHSPNCKRSALSAVLKQWPHLASLYVFQGSVRFGYLNEIFAEYNVEVSVGVPAAGAVDFPSPHYVPSALSLQLTVKVVDPIEGPRCAS